MIFNILTQEWQSQNFANAYLIESKDDNNLFLDTSNFINQAIFASSELDLGNNPDFLLVEPEIINGKEQQFITVAQSRNIIDFFYKSAWCGKYKVVLMSQADRMNDNAANALLKLLEDTPSNSFIFLGCKSRHSMLLTVKSRCRIISDTRINDANDIKIYLAKK